MKKLLLLALTFWLTTFVFSQNITGAWNGELSVQGTTLHLVVHITTDSAKRLNGTLDSPDQGALGLPLSSISFENSVLKFALQMVKIEYEGKIEADTIFNGTFKQGGGVLPLNFYKREKDEPIKVQNAIKHPQEPTKPYLYYSEDVTFENKKAGVTLAGTLTLPKKEGNYPVVILIAGSGPNNRDESILGQKPFLMISDFVTKQGVGVLRYDKRGIGASKGDYKAVTTRDFADDVAAAIDYLKTRKEVNAQKIGLIGHSEGGVIAPMIAAQSKDVNFIILLAGTGVNGKQLLLSQSEAMQRASQVSETSIAKVLKFNAGAFDVVMNEADLETRSQKLKAYFVENLKTSPDLKPASQSDSGFISANLQRLNSPWLRYFLNYDPSNALETVHCPVLALNGSKDTQVPAVLNLKAIKRSLEKAKNKNVTIKELPNLNHLFQECTTGLFEEYGTLEQTVSPLALTEIINFIKKQVE